MFLWTCVEVWQDVPAALTKYVNQFWRTRKKGHPDTKEIKDLYVGAVDKGKGQYKHIYCVDLGSNYDAGLHQETDSKKWDATLLFFSKFVLENTKHSHPNQNEHQEKDQNQNQTENLRHEVQLHVNHNLQSNVHNHALSKIFE